MIKSENRRTYWGLFVVNFLVCLGVGIVDPFFPIYATKSGATGFHLAILFSSYAIAKTIFSPLAGWCSDLKGRYGILLTGLLAYTVIPLGFLFSPNPTHLILLKSLQGVAAAFVRPVSLAFVGDMAQLRREGITMGTFDISFYSAFAVGPILGGVIKDIYGFPGVFYALFFLSLLALGIGTFSIKKPENYEQKSHDSAKLDLSVLKKSKLLISLCGFIFTRAFGIVLFAIYMPIYMSTNLNFKGIEIGMVMGISAVVMTLLLRPMGYFTDRINRKLLILLGGVFAAMLTVCLPMAKRFPILLGLNIGIGIASVLSLPASLALLVEEGNRIGMGLTMGIFNCAMNLGFVIAPLAGGIIFIFFGIKAIFYGAGLVGIVGIFFFLFYIFTPLSAIGETFISGSAVLAGSRSAAPENCICNRNVLTDLSYPIKK